ncbi:MAG: DUF6134 family protein [Pseudomonadota bacterium]
MKTRFFLFLLLPLMLLTSRSNASTENIEFDVYLNNKRIGQHTVTIDTVDNQKRVSVAANFAVKYLAIPFYRYEHTSDETWSGGCIQSVSTRTNDNGTKLSIDSEPNPPSLKVITKTGSQSLPGCVRTFAYWNPNLLDNSFLLNTQTGDYEQTILNKASESPLVFKGKQYGDQQYRLNVEDKPDIDLWYSNDEDWLALQTSVSKGNTLTYVKRQVN